MVILLVMLQKRDIAEAASKVAAYRIQRDEKQKSKRVKLFPKLTRG